MLRKNNAVPLPLTREAFYCKQLYLNIKQKRRLLIGVSCRLLFLCHVGTVALIKLYSEYNPKDAYSTGGMGLTFELLPKVASGQLM